MTRWTWKRWSTTDFSADDCNARRSSVDWRWNWNFSALNAWKIILLKTQKLSLLRLKILTFTNRKRSTPVSAGQAANFRCSNQRVSVVAWKLNFRSQLSCGCAQRESSSGCDFIAVNGFDFNDDCVRVSSWSHASVNSWILCFGWENTQSILEGWISSLVSVPAFRIFSRLTKIEIRQSNERDKWKKSYM